MSTPRYTLEEAAILLRNQQCKFHGHDTEVILKKMSNDPDYIICKRCGEVWQVLSNDRQPTVPVQHIDAPTVPQQPVVSWADDATQMLPKYPGDNW